MSESTKTSGDSRPDRRDEFLMLLGPVYRQLENFVFAMTGAIYGQVILFFLGLVPLAGENWGLMINQAYTKGAIFFKDSLLYILSPIVMISLLQLSLVMISNAMEDVFNPRLREE